MNFQFGVWPIFRGELLVWGRLFFRHQILWQCDVYMSRPREILYDFVLFRNAFLCISGSSKVLCAVVKLDHLSPILCGKKWQVWLSSKIFSCRFQELVCSFNTFWHTEVFFIKLQSSLWKRQRYTPGIQHGTWKWWFNMEPEQFARFKGRSVTPSCLLYGS